MNTGARAAAWAALLLLALAAIAWQSLHPVGKEVDEDDKPALNLVSLPHAQWSAVEFLVRGERVRFERDVSALWFRHEARVGETPGHDHPVDTNTAERIGATLATFSRTRIERSIDADDRRRALYGLNNPALIILIHGADGRMALTVEAGQVAADGLSRYIHVPQTSGVHTIPDYQIRGLLELVGAEATAATKTP